MCVSMQGQWRVLGALAGDLCSSVTSVDNSWAIQGFRLSVQPRINNADQIALHQRNADETRSISAVDEPLATILL